MNANIQPAQLLEDRIFVVDDDHSIRRSLCRLLRSAGLTVEAFESADAFEEREHHSGPSCLLLDLKLPGVGGMELQERLLAADRDIPTIFITGHADVPTSVKAMKRGAIDFLTKPFDDHDLLQAVRQALENDRRKLAEESRRDVIRERVQRLTRRERQVMNGVLRGMLNKQIGYELGISEKTVKVHRAHVMQKMGVPSVAELVHMAEQVDIVPLAG